MRGASSRSPHQSSSSPHPRRTGPGTSSRRSWPTEHQEMHMRKQRWFIAITVAMALFAAACGGGDDSSTTDTTAGDDTTTTEAVKEAPTFPAGSAMEALQKKG